MGNTANRQCPTCRSTDIQQTYRGITLVFHCNRCGYLWNASKA